MRDGVNRAWNCADAVRENAALREIIRSFDEDIAAGLGECNSARARGFAAIRQNARTNRGRGRSRDTNTGRNARKIFSRAY